MANQPKIILDIRNKGTAFSSPRILNHRVVTEPPAIARYPEMDEAALRDLQNGDSQVSGLEIRHPSGAIVEIVINEGGLSVRWEHKDKKGEFEL